MKIAMYIIPFALILSAGPYTARPLWQGTCHPVPERRISSVNGGVLQSLPVYLARGGGGGHGGSRGGHHSGGGHGHHGGGHHGHRNHHGGHGRHGWHGNHWHGPYYYGGWWWGPTGLFLVGLTFYTCTEPAIKNTNTWIIYNGDTTVYQSWPQDPDNLTIMKVEDDPDGYDYRICNTDNSCVKAKPTTDD